MLVWRELDHPPLEIGVKRRENFAARPKIGVAHVRTFAGSTETSARRQHLRNKDMV